MTLRTAVVIPTHNRSHLLKDALASIADLTMRPDEVWVVNDGSTDDTEQVIRAAGHEPLRTEKVGAAGARNAGIAASSADVIAFVDDDCVVDPEWLSQLVDGFAEGVGLVQGTTLPTGPVGPTDRTIRITAERGLYESCNIAYRRAALEEVGGFDPACGTTAGGPQRLGPGGSRPFGEDTDLAWRVRRRGWTTRFVPDAVVRHHVFPGTLGGVLKEQWRLAKFPWLVDRIPELRPLIDAPPFCLRKQSPLSQLFLAGLAITPARRAGLLLTLPYLTWLARSSPSVATAAYQAARDTVGSAALLTGSVRHRTVLL